MLLLLSVGNVLTGGFQLSAQEQSKRFSVKVDNITLKEAIEVIKKQGNYSFLIRNNDIDLNRKVSVNINNGTINDVMGQLLAGTDVSYEVNGPRVIMFHAVTPQKEQEKVFVLKGRITDPTGEGVIGANVKVVDSTEGTITDMDGNFSLMVTPNARLSISYIGYATQEVVVKDQRPLNVTLKEDTRLIDEVVVVGYGVQKKANLTGAVSSVKMDDVLGDRPVVSVSDALKGAMPGLQITGNSGRPGEEMSFNIRGVNSLDKNGKPLVLVDNVEMDINMLDPNDIESVTVLKDAASSAIYGARAAFGVILITTKKGSDATKLSINYSNNFSFSRPANMPHKATPLQTVQAYKDMGTINYQSGQNVDTWLGLLKEYNANPSAYPDGYAMVDGLRYSLAETDLFDDMMETGFQQTHNISVGGGTKDISYRFSFGMVNENGVLASDKDTYKRYNVSSYLRSDVFSWITPELDIKYTNSNSSLPETSGGYGIWGAAVAFPSYFPTGTMNIDGEELPINTPRNLIDLAYPTTIQKNNLRIFGKVTISPLKNVKFVFFDDCWNAESAYGKQPELKPGVHNSGWVQDPSCSLRKDTLTLYPFLQEYVKDIIRTYAHDDRILMWDLYNEPGNSKHEETSLSLLTNVFRWVRDCKPSQPITAGVWDYNSPRKNVLNAFMLNHSDIISYHNYDNEAQHAECIKFLKMLNRPLICTEYMARRNDSRFCNVLPLMKKEKTGAINWGFVAGKTNTIFAWDEVIPSGEEPELWFHDIYRSNGVPFQQEEVDCIQSLTGER
mgnify:CR=1 FL=1